jgi:hypothetical protein
MQKRGAKLVAGDICQSGEVITKVELYSFLDKVGVTLEKDGKVRSALWGKKSTIFLKDTE